jgi:hypothetical protein
MTDFSDIPTTSIDVSPSSCASDIVIALANDELEYADDRRYERFFRVWITEAPVGLKELCVVLRSNTDGKQLYTSGIDRFMQFLHIHVPIPAPIKFTVYSDNYTVQRNTHALLETMSCPRLLVGL